MGVDEVMTMLDTYNDMQTTLAAQEKVRAELDADSLGFGTAIKKDGSE